MTKSAYNDLKIRYWSAKTKTLKDILRSAIAFIDNLRAWEIPLENIRYSRADAFPLIAVYVIKSGGKYRRYIRHSQFDIDNAVKYYTL